ncbi:MAG: alpha/beta hydrolase [Acidimicrobiia bacterium]|nr:alpha/beta hydrolase [Acidimicrobiia bacterium]
MTDAPTLHTVVHEGHGPVALLVHGALGSRSYWAGNIAALTEVCQPVVVELWGHGRSPSPADPARYHPDAYVEEFERLRASLGVERWVTIGQSMGAALTLRYGLERPERVIAQVITNSSSAFSGADGWMERNRSIVSPMAAQIEAEGMEVLRDHWVNPATSRRIPAEIRALLHAEFDEHTVAGIAASFRHTNGHLPVRHRLAEVSRPTLLTLGTLEENFVALVPVARRIPGLEVVELAGGHPVNAQVPAEWNAAVCEYLRRVAP